MLNRFFSGARSGSSSTKASSIMMKALRQGKSGGKLSMNGEQRYQQIFAEKMAAMQKELSQGSKYGFAPPGTTQGERKLSKAAQAVVEKIAADQAKREAKKVEKAQKRAAAAKASKKAKEVAAQKARQLQAAKNNNPADVSFLIGGDVWGGNKDSGGWW